MTFGGLRIALVEEVELSADVVGAVLNAICSSNAMLCGGRFSDGCCSSNAVGATRIGMVRGRQCCVHDGCQRGVGVLSACVAECVMM